MACACQPGCTCRGRCGSGAGVIARALTLLLLGVGVGAAHSVVSPIKLRMDPTAPIEVTLPAPTSGGEPPTQTPGAEAGLPQATPGQGAGPTQPPDEPGTGPSNPPGDTIVLEQYLSLNTTRILWESARSNPSIAQFIDARHRDEFASGHIPGAVLMDPDDLRAGRLPEGFDFLDPTAITVIYCGGGDCDASENAARWLQDAGFMQVHIFKDGFPTWDAAGLPVNVGEPMNSTPRPARANPGGGGL